MIALMGFAAGLLVACLVGAAVRDHYAVLIRQHELRGEQIGELYQKIQARTAQVFDLKAVLREVEWAGDFCDDAACPLCLGRAFRGHGSHCKLGQALKS